MAKPPPPPLDLEDVPGAPPRGTVLCRVSDLADGEAKTFVYREDTFRFEMFAQRWGDAVFVYRNSCPHARLPLNMQPDRFLDLEGRHLFCANHGAFFRVQDGYCIKGPCKGDYLRPILIEQV
ncbi:MAG: Rieske 2Fe-2S domain-containing protein, partial [Alphaproteobacteria bacterium]|nr:Rieske 2Fe-2S domain-containing protein [Alphaproteobacteria bacterium]